MRPLRQRLERTFAGADGKIEISRDGEGVAHVRAASTADALHGLGWCHGFDRQMQMVLGRLVGRGRAAAALDGSDELFALDSLFRRLDLGRGAHEQVARLAPRDRELLRAYCDGVNRALRRHTPWELLLVRHRPGPWQPADTILLSRLMGYLGLAQTQGEMERVLVELVQAGASPQLLAELLPGQLQMLDADLLRGVRLGTRMLPLAAAALGLPSLAGSNAWAVAPSRAAGDAAVLANDPHLVINQLPATWSEIVLHHGERWCAGATIPGVPAVMIGRSAHVAWGLTYGGADALDSWVEECRDGCFERELDGERRWLPFRSRTEVVERRGQQPLTLTIFENEHGVLDGDARVAGRYLCTRWSAAQDTGAASLEAMFELLDARDCDAARALVGRVELSFNWILADRDGSIAYQMSGRVPRRAAGTTGLVPLPGCDPRHDWGGFLRPDELPHRENPAEGFIASANDDVNHLATAPVITLPVARYRFDRIVGLLRSRSDWTTADFEAMQMDRLSPQAVRYLDVLRPLLQGDERFAAVAAWDCVYDDDSREAAWFEAFRTALVEAALTTVCGEAGAFILHETTIVASSFGLLDDVLLGRDSGWHGAGGRDAAFLRAAEVAFDAPPSTLAERQPLVLGHLLLAGRLPAWAGFDRRTPGLRGGRATIHQGQRLRSAGRDVVVGPSYRMVTDLAGAALRTALPGGPSDRRTSRWYASGVDDWWSGRCKTLSGG
ncbi:MAG TPA: penicillin acylase family protein [Solirubrobacteraceae bacterium]|nr:penicillin acylase family protein [Solirubrobacteraceae bacterium]